MIRRSAIGLVLLALLALAVPASALAVERTVSVEATATIQVPNDSASFGLGVSLVRSSRGAALSDVSAKLKQVIAAVQSVPGVGEGDVKTGRIAVAKAGPGRFRAGEGIAVTLHEPSRAGDLVSAAIAAGVTGVRGPTFFVGDTEAAYTQALGAAFQRAKAKATALAAQAGASLGAALTINEGGKPEIVPFQDKQAATTPSSGSCGAGSQPATATKRAGSEACAPVPPPTKPGVSTVTATVGVIFALQ